MHEIQRGRKTIPPLFEDAPIDSQSFTQYSLSLNPSTFFTEITANGYSTKDRTHSWICRKADEHL